MRQTTLLILAGIISLATAAEPIITPEKIDDATKMGESTSAVPSTPKVSKLSQKDKIMAERHPSMEKLDVLIETESRASKKRSKKGLNLKKFGRTIKKTTKKVGRVAKKVASKALKGALKKFEKIFKKFIKKHVDDIFPKPRNF